MKRPAENARRPRARRREVDGVPGRAGRASGRAPAREQRARTRDVRRTSGRRGTRRFGCFERHARVCEALCGREIPGSDSRRKTDRNGTHAQRSANRYHDRRRRSATVDHCLRLLGRARVLDRRIDAARDSGSLSAVKSGCRRPKNRTGFARVRPRTPAKAASADRRGRLAQSLSA